MTEYNYSNFMCPCHLQWRAFSRPKLLLFSKAALYSSKQEDRVTCELRWRLGEEPPQHLYRTYYNTVATHKNRVYIYDHRHSCIYAYDASRSTKCWSQLPDHPNEMCSIAVISNSLTTIGGEVEHTVTNKLFSFTDGDESWTEKFPPMPTKRSDTTALCTGTSLIVAGGRGETGGLTVEVMYTNTLQWSSAAHLPHLFWLWRNRSLTLCGEQLFIANDTEIYQCEVTSLIQSCQSTTSTSSHSAHTPNTVWKEAGCVPVPSATCVSLNGHLLAIGGRVRSVSGSHGQTAVHMYNPATNSWTIISHMLIPRWHCFAAVLPDNQLVVVGGLGDPSNSVEIATLL